LHSSPYRHALCSDVRNRGAQRGEARCGTVQFRVERVEIEQRLVCPLRKCVGRAATDAPML
jgi:hypothetical protein